MILVFEVIVQPPKIHFLTFSSETKIMKITLVTMYIVKILHEDKRENERFINLFFYTYVGKKLLLFFKMLDFIL